MENFLSRLNRNPYAPIDGASVTRVDELGNGYDDWNNLIAPKFQAPEQTWGETALGVATAPARMTMGLVESLSPYGADGWQIPPIVNEGVNALTAVGDAYNYGMDQDEINNRAFGMAGFMMGGGGLAARPAGGTGMFAGRLAKTADQEALARAERLAAEGADRNAIWNETGWFQGPDQKWRFEIDDSGSSVRNSFMDAVRSGSPSALMDDQATSAFGATYTNADNLMSHPALFDAYPEARGVSVGASVSDTPFAQYGGWDRPDHIQVGAQDAGGFRKSALHEMQHDLQRREGFAYGGTATEGDGIGYLGQSRPELEADYNRLAGEVEARNVQTRMNMTPEQRRATPPWETQDIPFEDQIVRLYSNSDSRPAIAASGLDMSQEARLARARDMGFDTDSSTYRGLRKPYDPDTAKSMYYQMFTSNPMEAAEYGSNVVEAYLRKGRNLALDAGGRNFNSVPTDSLPPDFGLGPVARTDEIAHKARQAGYDSVTFNNVFDNATDTPAYAPKPTSRNAIGDDDLLAELGLTEDDIAALASGSQSAAYKEPAGVQPWDRRPTTVDVIFDPRNIRSVNAAFDPSKSDSANLLAANADSRPALLAGAIGGEQRGITNALRNGIQDYGGLLRDLGGDWQNAVVIDHAGNVVHGSLDGWSGKGSRLAVTIGPNGEIKKGFIAYHGSPHDFDKFDLSKIGTGEGAQAYGHGLYFAENEGTAKWYKDQISNGWSPVFGGEPWSPLNPQHQAAAYVENAKGNRSAALEQARKQLAERSRFKKEDVPIWQEVVKILEGDGQLLEKSKGHMYQVRINANPEDFLDWDKPLSQQSENLRNALAPLQREHERPYIGSMTGQDAYRGVQAGAGNEFLDQSAVLPILREAGIPGIKYLDQMSRNAGDGSRNYVVFDDSLIEILKKYGLLAPGAMYGGNALFSQAQYQQY